MFTIDLAKFPEEVIGDIASKMENPFSLWGSCHTSYVMIRCQRDHVFRLIWMQCEKEFADTISIEHQCREILHTKKLTPYVGICFLGNSQRREIELLSNSKIYKTFLRDLNFPKVYRSPMAVFREREAWICNINILKLAKCLQDWHGLIPNYKEIFQSSISLQAKAEACVFSLKHDKNILTMTDLVLEGAGLTRMPRIISLFTSLQKLYIFRNQVSGLPTDIFSHNPNLQRVSLGTNRIQHLQYVMFPRKCTIYIKKNPLFVREKNFLMKKGLPLLDFIDEEFDPTLALEVFEAAYS